MVRWRLISWQIYTLSSLFRRYFASVVGMFGEIYRWASSHLHTIYHLRCFRIRPVVFCYVPLLQFELWRDAVPSHWTIAHAVALSCTVIRWNV